MSTTSWLFTRTFNWPVPFSKSSMSNAWKVRRTAPLGGGRADVTVNDNVVEWVAPPPDALIVTVLVPTVAEAVAENETVTVQVGLHGLLVKVAVTPVGRFDAENVTCIAVPLARVATIDDDGLVEPWTTVRLLGEGVDRVKSNVGAATVNDNVFV